MDDRGPRWPRPAPRGIVGIAGILGVVVLALATAAVALAVARAQPGSRAKSPIVAQATSTPSAVVSVTQAPQTEAATGCPTPPAGTSQGAALYWAGSTTSPGARFGRPTLLCGAHFQSGERVTIQLTGTPDTLAPSTAQANSSGAFAVRYGQLPLVGCGASQPTAQARGDQGSHAEVLLPPGPPLGCAQAATP